MKHIEPQKTTIAKQLKEDERPWFLVDAKDKTLGRLATRIAKIISGRDRSDYTPHLDNGAHVVIINAKDVRVTGAKLHQKMYRSHSYYPGGLKETRLEDVLVKNPTKPVEKAIYGMLPKNKLRKAMYARLHVFEGLEHKHDAQKPIPLTLA